jgi:hypothetical protein
MATIKLKLTTEEAKALAVMLADEMVTMRERSMEARLRDERFAEEWCNERAELARNILNKSATAVHHPVWMRMIRKNLEH